ncbi:hypothetical protein WMY93_002246 [Mugilogobius chulae]|uniref:C3H1-type domain-containing protein n=1 Tax=Mugilogobius chulae TaxID=88201 RepID=A0AAW0PTU3_9GOBI
MGLKDQGDGTGHILELEYLHVHGAQRAFISARKGAANQASEGALQGSPTRTPEGAARADTITSADLESCVDGSTSSTSGFCGEACNSEVDPGSSSAPEEALESPDLPDQRCKVDFALKLGYTEEQVRLVLRKLGPCALANDILGELVKYGTKLEFQVQNLPLPPSPLSSLSPHQWSNDKNNLRPVVLDGSNVAMSHGNKEVFSCQGIQLAVEWFLERGHRDITVFVPAWRKEQSRPDAPISEQEILRHLEKQKILVFTPSRRVQGRRVVCYDDRFIVKLAHESDGIIVSNDNYRDLANEKPEWKKFIDERLLMYSFVNDKFMPPDDPLGRHGPSLDNFLRKRPIIPENRRLPCPYGKKCTYGHKCKFFHPERGSQPQRAVADELRASARISNVSRSLMEDVLSGTSHSLSEEENPEHWQSTPNKESFFSLRGSISDLCEEHRKIQSRRGSSSSSSSSSGCSSFFGYPAPPSPGSLDRWDPIGSGIETPKSVREPRSESPEAGYSSMVKAYSGLRLEFPDSPEQCSTVPDLTTESLFSDCSSEGCSNIFSPDFRADSGPRAHLLHKQKMSLCPPVYTGRPKDSSSVFTQDMSKQYSFKTNYTFAESTSFQTCSVGHKQHIPQSRSQELSSQEHNSSSVDSQPDGYHSGFTLNSFDEISAFHSQANCFDPAFSSVSIQQSPQSTCRGLSQHGQQMRFAFEGSPSSDASYSNHAELSKHSPQAHPFDLRQQGSQCLEELPPLDCQASQFLHHCSPDCSKPGIQTYPFVRRDSFANLAPSRHSFIPHPQNFMPSKGFPGDNIPPKTSLHLHHLSSHQAYSKRHHLWKNGSAQEAHMYNMANERFSSPDQAQASWVLPGQQPYKPYHLFEKNPEETGSSSLASPALSQYNELRQKLFLNLCSIFPTHLVRLVMTTNPCMLDAQELAAAILLAKSQCLT